MTKKNTFVLAALLSHAGVTRAVTIPIDLFDLPAGGQSATIFNGLAGSTATVTIPVLSALGGWREMRAVVQNVLPGGSTLEVAANTATSPFNYQLSSSINMDALGSIHYDANGAGLNFDFSGMDSFHLLAVANDQGTMLSLTLETFGGGSSVSSIAFAAGSAADVAFPIASFAGGASLLDVDRITVTIDPGPAGDVSIGGVTVSSEEKMPEGGATIVLLSLGTFTLLGMKRRTVRV